MKNGRQFIAIKIMKIMVMGKSGQQENETEEIVVFRSRYLSGI